MSRDGSPAEPAASRFSASRIAAMVVAAAFFMEGLDSSIISTSLPQMASSFGVSPSQMSAAITSYLVSLAIFIPISGWVADRFGARKVFCLAIVLFTIGSVMCGFSNSLWALVISRIVQGFGGAMMTPVGRLILTRIFPKNELMRAMSYFMLPGMFGPVVGPLIGGFVTTYFSWHWNFFINVPLGIIGIALAIRFIPDVTMPPPEAFDYKGFMIIAAGLGIAQVAIESLGRETISGPVQFGLFTISGALLLAYRLYATRRPSPVLDFRMFRIRTFSVAVLAGSIIRSGLGTIPFLLPLLLQVGFGLDPLQSGFLTAFNTAGKLSMRAWVSNFLKRFGFRNVFLVGAVISALMVAGVGLFTAATPHALIAIYLFIFGVLRSAQTIGLGALAYSEVEQTDMSKATSIYALVQRFSQSLGVGVSASLLTVLSNGDAITVADFGILFLILGLLIASSIIGLCRLKSTDGNQVSGYRLKPASGASDTVG